jgi:hypothetical protein
MGYGRGRTAGREAKDGVSVSGEDMRADVGEGDDERA